MESTEGDTNHNTILLLSADVIPASNVVILVIIILVLILMSAIVAGAETAYFSLTLKDINFLKNKKRGPAHQAAVMLERPKILLAALLVSNNFINIAIVITMNYLIGQLFPGISGYFSFFINIVCVTFLLVLFGEVLPKVYATQHNLRLAIFAAPYIKTLMFLFMPVSQWLVSSTKFIEERLAQKKGGRKLSSEDFEHAIELTMGHSATREEVNIFKGIIKFGNIPSKQVMRTRLDVSAVDFEMTFDEVKNYCIEAGYSRLPVYRESLDNIAGMIHTKDFLQYYDKAEFDWHALMRPAFFVHESKLIDDLLKEFQQKRIHFAIVVDEFGGTSGIITLEDIMEEIIGDIRDEFDEEDLNYKKIDDNNFLFEGKTLINDVCRVIGEQPDRFDKIRGESDSLAGLILEIAGQFPTANESFKYQNFEFTVVSIARMRIENVKLTILSRSPREDD